MMQDYQELDRKWFEAHPKRTHYVRRFIDGEWPPDREATSWTVVRQIASGIRMRLGFDIVDTGGFFDAAQTDDGAKLMFDMALEDNKWANTLLAKLIRAAAERDGGR